MLMNNLDPDVAERWEDLVVYGGAGKAARNWDAFHRIVASLRSIESDETLRNPNRAEACVPPEVLSVRLPVIEPS